MSGNFYSTQFDLAIVSGPRLPFWPTTGVRELSTLCSKFGLETAWIGGPGLSPKGVLSTGSSGGMILAEDAQGRTHRVEARAIVKFVLPDETPSPFEGFSHPSVFLGSTAMKLKEKSAFIWNEPIAIIGTGNRALRFGSELIEQGCPEVSLIETHAQWGGKRYSGWEVERRRFEVLGGEVIEAQPVSFKKIGSGIGELRLKDRKGIRLLEVSRVVSFGPFSRESALKEHPPGSLLFELEQTSLPTREADPEGWLLEEERARILSVRIVRALVQELGNARDELEAIHRRSRNRIKRMDRHYEEPFEFSYSGKWTSAPVLKFVKQFSGVPHSLQTKKPVASVECFETIGCDLCERACPTRAIRFDRLRSRKAGEEPRPILDETACIACGLCLQVCPSATPILLHEPENLSMGVMTFSWREREAPPEAGTGVALRNRQGESLGTGRVLSQKKTAAPEAIPVFSENLVEVEVPSHLIWEVRGIRKPLAHSSATDQEFLSQNSRNFMPERVEISWNGERRFVRGGIPISTAFFENGFQRSNDRLLCEDGSCSLCEVEVDGIKQLACKTMVRKGMAIRSIREESSSDDLCPCLGIQESSFMERVGQGSLQSVDAAFESTGLGSGRCHGQLCVGPAKRCLEKAGISTEEIQNHIDWRFPWSDWKIAPGKN